MKLEIIGSKIYTEQDFHNQITKIFCVEGFYGKNLDALWDLLSANVERPVMLIWQDSQFSKDQLGSKFFEIVEILERVKRQDRRCQLKEKFDYSLE
ncbi:barstar family protein [Eikenella sp. S3360]|uniref:Barstar family protein n=1 Tax=Eikenella glucosivorans TaxID=2766967 RepID=A0ABS0NBT6_9NEIS|nr:barstar family protein [Eikenella glucosivorans]MBH5329775.1 barstar family protein [Eikenella glucosivorans]